MAEPSVDLALTLDLGSSDVLKLILSLDPPKGQCAWGGLGWFGAGGG